MININFNNGTVEDFTIVLSDRSHCHKGQIVNADDFVYKANLNSANEISFTVYKELGESNEPLWNEIIDLRLVWIKELNEYFEIYVSGSESSNLIKYITGTSLCEAELSQTLLRNIEINSESDIERDDYVVTKFYDSNNHKGSLLHRILDKAPHYSIKHVDESLQNLQRTFSIDNSSIYDFLTGECAEQFNCLFQFDSVERSISVYDLYTVCEDCGYRGEFNDVCPECNSTNLFYYGTDTTIFVSSDNLTDEITYNRDVDSIKNCFRLETGDDNMTATVIACNPNGSAYLYYFSDEQKHDMPDELVDKIESYDALVESYSEEYQELSEELYDCIDKIIYYQSEMMPTVEIAEVTASTEAAKLTVANLSPIGLTTVVIHTSTATVNSALKNFAKVFIKTGFVKIEVDTGSFTYVGTDNEGYNYGNWTGRFKVTNYSDEEDIAYSDTITVKVTSDYNYYLAQKIQKNIASNDSDDGSIFDVLSITNLDTFKNAITYYCYNRLESFADAIQGVIDILIEENQSSSNSTYYNQFYTPYYNKLVACQNEMNIRSATIKDYEDKEESLIKQRNDIQNALNLETYLGEELYAIFCSYRREDTYKNDNYISDGLNNAEIFRKALEFIGVAKHEIVKSGEHQHSISADLYNLLIMKEFAPIADSFELGNWIRCKFDDAIYRLRLISYEVRGKDLSSINAEFADMTKTANGVNDLKSIIQDAQSMASSYSYVSKQASTGDKAYESLNQIKENGLSSSLINIKNNDYEEITYDQHGILCRAYDDIEDKYSDKQLKLTHNVLAFTRDNWQTSSLALGEHDYYYYDGGVLTKSTGYGLTSDFVISGYIYGSQIIGGDIYSQNYSSTSGTYINLNDGSFSFAGGKLTYDIDEKRLNIRGFLYSDMKTMINEVVYETSYEIAGCHGTMNIGDTVAYKYGSTNGTSLITSGIVHATSLGYLGFAVMDSSDGTPSMKYIINNGVNPNGCKERHVFSGAARFWNSLYCHDIYLPPSGTSTDASQYVNLYNLSYDGGRAVGCGGGFYAYGSIGCSGTKYRVVDTDHYGKVGMNAFETPEPYFADIGSGTISEIGSTTIFIDPIFAETIDMNSEYQVFITSSSAQVYVTKEYDSFTVYGEEGTSFDWMICAKQKNYSAVRMAQVQIDESRRMSHDEGEIIW